MSDDGVGPGGSARFRRAVIAAAVAVAIFLAWLGFGFFGPFVTTAVDDLGALTAALLAAYACHRRALREVGRVRRGWRLLGTSALAWGLGEAVWSYIEVIAGREVPFPSLADAGYLAAVPLALAAVLAFFSPPAGWTSRLRLAVDGLIIGVAVLYLSWVGVLGPLVDGSDGGLLSLIVSMAYPIGDVILISAVILVGARSRTADGASLGWIFAGLVGMAVSDSAFTYLSLQDVYVTNLLDGGWFAGNLCIALGAMKPEAGKARRRRSGAREFTLLAYVPVSAVLLIGTARLMLGRPHGGLQAYLTALLFALVVVRQVFTLRENQALTSDLEAKVRARTAELHQSEGRLRALFETVSDVISVVDPGGTVRFVSPSIEEVFGYVPSEVVGENLFGFLHPDDIPAVAAFLGGRGETNRRLNVRVRHRGGGWRHVEAVGAEMAEEGTPGGFVFATRDMTDRRELEEQLAHQAFHDPLTGLANRALLSDRIRHALTRIGRTGLDLAVLFVDVDDFKQVNDTLGHAAGDDMLLDLSRRLKACVRAGDTVARLGGDEFAVLMEEADEEAAVSTAERLRAALAVPVSLGDTQIRSCTASVGIALSGPETMSEEEMLRNADVAMYQAKDTGKACHVVFRPEMHEVVVRRFALLADLRAAVDDDQFELHYQPLVGLTDRKLAGFEALVRWRHPVLGIVPPGEFIALAEETGLIIPLGQWVLEEAVGQLAAWDRVPRPGAPLTMSINVSGRQLQDPEFPATVARAIERCGIEPSRITLELTESVLLDDVTATIAWMHELKNLGVRLAIDDFGTGFSSLSYLSRFPVDTIKVDKSFVDGLGTDRGTGLARSLLDLGAVLGLKTVAEGIEHDHQAALLETSGCDFGQGYIFSRPVPASAAEAILRDQAAMPLNTAG